MKLPGKKLSPKIIALDLDDTLLTDELTISPRTVATIRRAAAQGIFIVIASGRTDHAILPFVHTLNIAGYQTGRYIISHNGAQIYDLHVRERIYSRTVPAEVFQFVYREAKRRNLPIAIYEGSTVKASMDTKWVRVDTNLSKLTLEVIEDYDRYPIHDAPKIIIPADPERIEPFQTFLQTELAGRAVVFTSKPFFLEVLPANSGKGEALLWLAQKLNIPHAQTMAFGDSMNDRSMIAEAGYGVAMCNGRDEIKECADYITRCDNNHDGAADFIEAYVL